MSKFERPKSLAFPTVYRTFRAKDKDSDEVVEYRIQDLLEEDFERAIDLLATEFVTDETLLLCRGVPDDEATMSELKMFWHEELKKKISVGCYKNGSDDLVGVNLLVVYDKIFFAEIEGLIKSPLLGDCFTALYDFETRYSPFEHHNVDKYLSDYGLVTSKMYRYRGVATEFFRAREPILRALNLKLTSTLCTVVGSQKAAVNANHKLMFSWDWSEIGKLHPNFDFSKSKSQGAHIYDFKIE